jgi:hypothetical protein
MTKIVGVHGIGQQFKGEDTIRKEWLPALKDGLTRSGHQLASDEDFACAFYGNLFRSSGKSAMDPPYNAKDVTDDWERNLLELWWQEATMEQPGVVSEQSVKTKVSMPSIIQRALNGLSQSTFFSEIAERALIVDLKQVRLYLHDPDIRCESQASLGRAIGFDTRVIIAHSLGSVVAYEALCAHPEWPVRVFVTLGSPLGIRNLIFDALDPSPVNGLGNWPGKIEQWINISDIGDVVALTKELSSRFGPMVKDYSVDNGAKAHDATRYLTTRELGYAVAAGL